MNRLDVREQILTCEGCDLCRKGNGPVPFSGPTPNFLAILGEAPGKQEDAQGKPFVCPSGELLRSALADAHLDAERIFMVNTVSCFPDRAPTPAEVKSCKANLDAQLELANPAWLCVLGGTALSTLRPDLRISRTRGHVLLPPERRWKAFVTFHPSYALRNAKGEQLIRDDIKILAEMMEADDILVPNGEDERPIPGWVRYVTDSCVACGSDVDEVGEHGDAIRFDSWGASYCSPCYASRAPESVAATKAIVKEAKAVVKAQEKTGQLFQ